MTLRTIAVIFWGCLLATAALAGEKHRTKIEIAVDGDDAEHRVFKFDSQDSGIDVHSLEVGEKKLITDDDGNETTIIRTADGFDIDIDGKQIQIGELDIEMTHDMHADGDVVIKKHKDIRVIRSDQADGVTIISGEEIDADTRARLQEVLKDAGQDGEIMFIDGSELTGEEQAHGEREVRIIKKKIDATN